MDLKIEKKSQRTKNQRDLEESNLLVQDLSQKLERKNKVIENTESAIKELTERNQATQESLDLLLLRVFLFIYLIIDSFFRHWLNEFIFAYNSSKFSE